MQKVMSAAALSLLVLASAHGQAPPARVLRISFVGDIMCHAGNLATRDYRDVYRGVEGLLASDDLTFANLESPADPARPASGYPQFNAPPSWIDAAVGAGVDVFSLANNHAFDQGVDGITSTPRELARASEAFGRPLYWNGTREDPRTAFEPLTIECGGLRIGYLAVTQFVNYYQGTPYVWTVDYADQSASEAFLRLVEGIADRFDLLIVSYHGDREYRQDPSPAKMAFFDRLVAAGVDVIFAHHPHVLQAPQFAYAGFLRRLVLPSMGNFISAMGIYLDPATGKGEVPGTADSAIMQVDVRCGGGVATVLRAQAVLIATWRNQAGELVIGRLADLARGMPGLSPTWTAWYGKRLKALEGLVEGAVPTE